MNVITHTNVASTKVIISKKALKIIPKNNVGISFTDGAFINYCLTKHNRRFHRK